MRANRKFSCECVAYRAPRVASWPELLRWLTASSGFLRDERNRIEILGSLAGMQSAVIACGGLLLICQLKPIRLWVNLIGNVAVLLCCRLLSLTKRKLVLHKKEG